MKTDQAITPLMNNQDKRKDAIDWLCANIENGKGVIVSIIGEKDDLVARFGDVTNSDYLWLSNKLGKLI